MLLEVTFHIFSLTLFNTPACPTWICCHRLIVEEDLHSPNPFVLEQTYPPPTGSAATILLNAAFWINHKVFGVIWKG